MQVWVFCYNKLMNFEKPAEENNEEEKLLEMPNADWAEKKLGSLYLKMLY